MSLFEVLNGGLETMFKEISKSKSLQSRKKEKQFEELEQTPFLFSPEYLDSLLEDGDKEDCNTILDYLYRFNNHHTGENETLDILDINGYKNVEKKIIDRMW